MCSRLITEQAHTLRGTTAPRCQARLDCRRSRCGVAGTEPFHSGAATSTPHLRSKFGDGRRAAPAGRKVFAGTHAKPRTYGRGPEATSGGLRSLRRCRRYARRPTRAHVFQATGAVRAVRRAEQRVGGSGQGRRGTGVAVADRS